MPESACVPGMEGSHVRLYLPARTAIVLRPVDLDPEKNGREAK